MPSTTRGPEGYRQQDFMRVGRRRWIAGVSVVIVTMALVGAAAFCSTSSVRANNKRCLESLANDEDIALEAFFQNPAEQDALVQAVTQCAR
ncbi:hypothetical protein QFZ94_004488 [Paraburkholderia sp. JPY465]|uniref:hypothetical protein n=1 Tax=Paraburkholderia sp. JPY465 TaxID=3042285 RepID=UPI003D253B51